MCREEISSLEIEAINGVICYCLAAPLGLSVWLAVVASGGTRITQPLRAIGSRDEAELTGELGRSCMPYPRCVSN
jgi:hypothetical protein